MKKLICCLVSFHFVEDTRVGLVVCLLTCAVCLFDLFPVRPSVVSITESPVTLHEGESFNLTCFARGDPPLGLSWVRASDGVELATETDALLSVVYELSSVNVSDSGEYICRVRNEAENITYQRNITVNVLTEQSKCSRPYTCQYVSMRM